MTTHRPSRPGSAAEGPYEGILGKTRVEAVHIPGTAGLRSVDVYTQVDVRTSPELREPALSGRLHLLEDGWTVAVSFLFHDPMARRFALVIPEALRHRELHERARILRSLSKETDVPIPTYVRAMRTVVGVDALRAYLEEPSTGDVNAHATDLRRRELALLEWQERLAAEETRLRYEAEEYRRLEAETMDYAQVLRAQEVDLQLRKEAIDRWLDELPDEERSDLEGRLATLASAVVLDVANVTAVDELDVDEPLEDLESDSGSLSRASVPALPTDAPANDAFAVADEEIEEVDAVLSSDDESVEDAVEDVEDAVEDIIDDDEVEEVSDDEAEFDADTEDLADELFANPETEMVAAALDGRLRIALKVATQDELAFTREADLLVQLATASETTAVVLSLVDRSGPPTGPAPFVRRVVLDPNEPKGRPLLEAIREDGAAIVDVFGEDTHLIRRFELIVPRRVNVALLLEHLDQDRQDGQPGSGADFDIFRKNPPPVWDADHPFQVEDPTPAESIRAAMERLGEAVVWSNPERLKRVLLTLSVPQDIVDDTLRQSFVDAVKFGFALPEAVRTRAVALGAGPSAADLTARAVEAFTNLDSDDQIRALTLHEVADNWRMLLTLAETDGIALRAPIVECAQARIRLAATAGAEVRAEPSKA